MAAEWSSDADPATTPGDWTRKIWVPLLVVAVGGLPYVLSGALHSDYVFDDVKLVKENESIRDLSTIWATFDITSDRWDDEDLRANYRPVRFLSYAIDYWLARRFCELWGLEFQEENPPATIFHVTNLLIHLLNALLLLSIGRRLLGHGPTALFLALIFALHPIQTEAVVYISGRRDVLSLFFFLAALRVYLADRQPRAEDGVVPGAGRDLSWSALVAIPVLFACGLLSKEMVVTLPAVLVLIDLLARETPRARRVALHAVLWTLALGFTALEVSNERLVADPVGGDAALTALMAPRWIARYLFLVLFPVSQSIDYSHDAIPESTGFLSPPSTIVSLVVAAGLLIAGLWCLARGGRRGIVALGILWFLGTLTPVLQIVPIPERFAERFVYLPGIGVLLLAALAFLRLERLEVILSRGIAVVVLLVLLGATYARCLDWRTPLTLWESAVAAQPRAARARIAHANHLRDAGDLRDAAREYTEAIEILEEDPEGLEREPLRRGQLLQARLFRADVLARLGAEDEERYAAAIDDYLWLLEQQDVDGTPIAESGRHVVIHYQLGSCYMGRGEWDAAERHFRIVIERGAPASLVRASHYFLGRVYLAQSRPADAARELGEAYRLAAGEGTLRDRYGLVGEYADALAGSGELGRARDLLQSMLSEIEASGDGDLLDGRKHLLFRLARVHDRDARVETAVRTLEEALGIDGEYLPALLLLADIEEKRGDLERARGLYEQALAINPRHPQAQRGLQSVEIRLALAESSASDAGARDAREKLKLARGLLDRGKAHFEALELSAAEDLFHRVAGTESSPDSPVHEEIQAVRAEALRQLARIGLRYRKREEARRYLLAALEASGSANDALLDLADLELRGGEIDAARRHYEEYLGRIPEGELGRPHAYYNLALLIHDERPLDALALCEKAREAGYDRPELERELGYVHTRLGNWRKALQHFEAFLERAESDLEKRQVMDFINLEVRPNLSSEEE